MAGGRKYDIDVDGLPQLMRDLKATPERLDKVLRKELRDMARTVRDKARERARSAHPQPKDGDARRDRRGAYRWSQLVSSIVSGAKPEGPYVQLGREDLPGWAGWEFGSFRYRQFPPRSRREGRGNEGYFFFPAVKDEAAGLTERVQRLVDRYVAETFPER